MALLVTVAEVAKMVVVTNAVGAVPLPMVILIGDVAVCSQVTPFITMVVILLN